MITDAEIVLVLGAQGMVGSAICRLLTSKGVPYVTASTDLRIEECCRDVFQDIKPDYVFHCAAKVGGIHANDTLRVDFLNDNLRIGLNVLQCAYEFGTKKLLNLGSSCIYPRLTPQPIPEDALLTGTLEETNRSYALAKISILELCKAYRSQYGCNFITAMPCNLYGPGDNFSLETGHVLPALIHKFLSAHRKNLSSVTLWGDGSPWREFLHVDDLASACLFLMNEWDEPDHVNVGMGRDITIRVLAEFIADIVGYNGTVNYDTSKPNGTPKKLLDITKMTALGWEASISLNEGLTSTIEWVENRLNAGLPIRGWTQ